MRSLEKQRTRADRDATRIQQSLSPDYRVNGGTFATVRAPPGAAARINGRQRRQPLRRRLRRRRRDQPGADLVHQRRRERQGLSLRGLARRHQLSGVNCPGLQDYKQIVVAVKLDTPGNQVGERGYVEVQLGLHRPHRQRRSTTRSRARTASSPRSSSSSPTLRCAASGTTARQEITGDHLLHNTLGTCASGLEDRDRRKSARRTRCCSAARPIPTRPTNRTRRSTTTPTTPTSSRRRIPTRGVQIRPRRHQRLPLHPDRHDQPRVPGPPLGDRPDAGAPKLQDDRQRHARVLLADAERSQLHGHALRLPLQTPRNRLADRSQPTPC